MYDRCGVCDNPADLWSIVDDHAYTDCAQCGSIAIVKRFLDQLDDGTFERRYDAGYRAAEDHAAFERSWGGSLARSAEAILLCRRPVQRFLDIGSGPGYLLDALSYHLPGSQDKFYGVEANPPVKKSSHSGYQVGYLGDLPDTYDCGVCVEVVEHLTPHMLKGFVRQLRERSAPDSLFLFNTGLAPYTREECPSYIDPLQRGHVVSWGWQAIHDIFGQEGFTVHRLGNREWLFAAEYQPSCVTPICDRIWDPLPENLGILQDSVSGSVMHILARESVRAYA